MTAPRLDARRRLAEALTEIRGLAQGYQGAIFREIAMIADRALVDGAAGREEPNGKPDVSYSEDVVRVTDWLYGLRANALKVNDVGYGPEGKPLADRCTQALDLIYELAAGRDVPREPEIDESISWALDRDAGETARRLLSGEYVRQEDMLTLARAYLRARLRLDPLAAVPRAPQRQEPEK